MGDRQLDILFSQSNFFTLPRYLPGRLNTDDFIFFRWCSTIDPKNYDVVVESNDVSGPSYRKISPLLESVELPHVRFPWRGRLGVIPKNDKLPSFESELSRGSTYIIPDTHGKNGRFQMEKHGMDRPN